MTKEHYTLTDLKIDLMKRRVDGLWESHMKECPGIGTNSDGKDHDEGCYQDEEYQGLLGNLGALGEALEEKETKKWYNRAAWLAERGYKPGEVMDDERGEYVRTADEENSKQYLPKF
jgi:hypothetical protein